MSEPDKETQIKSPIEEERAKRLYEAELEWGDSVDFGIRHQPTEIDIYKGEVISGLKLITESIVKLLRQEPSSRVEQMAADRLTTLEAENKTLKMNANLDGASLEWSRDDYLKLKVENAELKEQHKILVDTHFKDAQSVVEHVVKVEKLKAENAELKEELAGYREVDGKNQSLGIENTSLKAEIERLKKGLEEQCYCDDDHVFEKLCSACVFLKQPNPKESEEA